MAIIDFDTRFPNRSVAAHAARCPSSSGSTTPPAAGVDLGVKAVARVDHSRWIADCPSAGCGGAEFVSPDRPFFCSECRNAATRNVPVAVVFPDEKTRTQIEAYLDARPVPANRNWSPSETVRQLRAENRDHGVRLS